MLADQPMWRSITAGLLAACVVLLAQLPLAAPRVRPPCRAFSPTAVRYLTLGANVRDVVPLLRLRPGERVLRVDGARVTGDLEAGVVLARKLSAPVADFVIQTTRTRILVSVAR